MSSVLKLSTVATKPFNDQKPGTSGLRKPTSVFTSPNYLENFIQSIFNAVGLEELKNGELLVGGDGRYYVKDAAIKIIQMAAANGIKGVVVAHDALMSTPAMSVVIRKRAMVGGIILTASHNPGGPKADFGVKYNCSNGGPAPESVTVIDSVADYVDYMKNIFDFESIRAYLSGGNVKIRIDSLNGVMGPYAKEVICNALGQPESCVVNCVPKEDFGGLHPDPNLTYAAHLVDEMKANREYKLGAAFDGDGDRNMVLGEGGFFVNPSDSVAVLANNAVDAIPYFKAAGGLKGVARSMPTGCAIDLVAKKRGVACYEVPTGWKFFGNLMDAGKLSICGEESFGTGSDHIREKDGMWAVLAWLSVLAHRKAPVADVVAAHWKEFGRNFFTRYDFEGVESAAGDEMMALLEGKLSGAAGNVWCEGGESYKIKIADNFSYTDPIDGSVSTKQGIRFIFEDGSRILFRLSGTGSSGATIRVYIEKYESDEAKQGLESADVLKHLVAIALREAEIERLTGRSKPSVIT